MRQQTKYDLFAITLSSDPQQEPVVDTSIVGLVTRRAAYNVVLNARPRKSRWRPYVDAGPVFQLLSLDGAPLKQPSGYFRLGLSNVGLIQAAFDFGNVPLHLLVEENAAQTGYNGPHVLTGFDGEHRNNCSNASVRCFYGSDSAQSP